MFNTEPQWLLLISPLVSLLLSRNSCHARDIMDSQHSAKAKLCSLLDQQHQLNNLVEFQKSVP